MRAAKKRERIVPAIDLPTGSPWATDARKQALATLQAEGLPQNRDEYWRNTNPSSLLPDFQPQAEVFDDGAPPVFAPVDALRIVFRDGVFDAEASDDLSLEGVEIEPLSQALNADIHWAQSVFGTLEKNGQTPVERPLAALNTATAIEGIVVRATTKVSRPIGFTYLHESETSDATIHHVIKLDEGADLTLLEQGPAASRTNMLMEVDIADSAAFHHVRAQGRDHQRRAVTHMFARLGKESSFKSFTLTMNGVLTRNEVVIELTGDDAHATVAGACAGDGDFHHDDTVFVTHDAVNCESRQVFKKVLRNGATGVFQGKILVQPDAQKTDGYQISQALLLDDDSNFLAKPELEIYADDVACSHGSTCGAIDKEALFYLTSRGIPRAEAADMLVLSFLAEAIEEIEDEALAELVSEQMAEWMRRRHD